MLCIISTYLNASERQLVVFFYVKLNYNYMK